jgi:hypothetical protein
MIHNRAFYNELNKIMMEQNDEVNDEIYQLADHDEYGYDRYEIYFLNTNKNFELASQISYNDINDLYNKIDLIKKCEDSEYGKRVTYFTNSKNHVTYITEFYDYLCTKEIFEPPEFIKEITSYNINYTINGTETQKNVMLESLLKLIEYFRYSNEYENDDLLINRFKDLVSPDYEKEYENYQYEFDDICKKLKSKNYYIHDAGVVFFDFSKMGLRQFAYTKIRDFLISRDNILGSVPWKLRRDFINFQMSIVKKNNFMKDSIVKELNQINFMTPDINNYDQTLTDICNYIEYKLKSRKNTFIDVEKENKYRHYTIINEFLGNEDIIKYRKQIQCFRHHSKGEIEKRDKLSAVEKELLISYGHTICLLVNNTVNESDIYS